MPPPPQPRGRGEDLRGEIVTATKQLLAEAGDSDAVSIRAVAEAVGVTPPSIYLHFADKDQLLEAVVVDVFAELDTAMMAAAESAAGPLERLRAFGLAYVRFAVEHPEHYRLATMERCPEDPTGAMTLMDKVLAERRVHALHGRRCATAWPRGSSPRATRCR